MDNKLIELILTHHLFSEISLIDDQKPQTEDEDIQIDWNHIIDKMYDTIGLAINHDNYPDYNLLLKHLETLYTLNMKESEELEAYRLTVEEYPSEYLFMYPLGLKIEMEQLFYVKDEHVSQDAHLIFINNNIKTKIEDKVIDFVSEIFGTTGLLYLLSLEENNPTSAEGLSESQKRLIKAIYSLDTTELSDGENKKFISYLAVISAK